MKLQIFNVDRHYTMIHIPLDITHDRFIVYDVDEEVVNIHGVKGMKRMFPEYGTCSITEAKNYVQSQSGSQK